MGVRQKAGKCTKFTLGPQTFPPKPRDIWGYVGIMENNMESTVVIGRIGPRDYYYVGV